MKRTFMLMSAFAALGYATKSDAQTTIPQNIFNATGGSALLNYTDQWDWSIGEISLVNTYYAPNIIVTQGFLQNELSTPQRVNNTELGNHLQVFPNPASSIVNVRYASPADGKVTYRLMDMAGKTVIEQTKQVRQGTVTEQMNIANLANATYMLEISCSDDKNVVSSASYKIEKLN